MPTSKSFTSRYTPGGRLLKSTHSHRKFCAACSAKTLASAVEKSPEGRWRPPPLLFRHLFTWIKVLWLPSVPTFTISPLCLCKATWETPRSPGNSSLRISSLTELPQREGTRTTSPTVQGGQSPRRAFRHLPASPAPALYVLLAVGRCIRVGGGNSCYRRWVVQAELAKIKLVIINCVFLRPSTEDCVNWEILHLNVALPFLMGKWCSLCVSVSSPGNQTATSAEVRTTRKPATGEGRRGRNAHTVLKPKSATRHAASSASGHRVWEEPGPQKFLELLERWTALSSSAPPPLRSCARASRSAPASGGRVSGRRAAPSRPRAAGRLSQVSMATGRGRLLQLQWRGLQVPRLPLGVGSAPGRAGFRWRWRGRAQGAARGKPLNYPQPRPFLFIFLRPAPARGLQLSLVRERSLQPGKVGLPQVLIRVEWLPRKSSFSFRSFSE